MLLPGGLTLIPPDPLSPSRNLHHRLLLMPRTQDALKLTFMKQTKQQTKTNKALHMDLFVSQQPGTIWELVAKRGNLRSGDRAMFRLPSRLMLQPCGSKFNSFLNRSRHCKPTSKQNLRKGSRRRRHLRLHLLQ